MQMTSFPLVSVVMPTYNGEKFLDKALMSVFAQTYKNYEVIVVDDDSQIPQTEAICRKYGDRIKYVKIRHAGQSAARNAGIRNSRGEYIAFLDDDDLWMSEKLEKQITFYETLKAKGIHPGLIYTGHRIIDESGVPFSSYLYKCEGNQLRTLLFLDFIGTPSSVMTTRSVLDDVGFFDESMTTSEDFELWLRIARKYPIYSVNEILIGYRDRLGSVSKSAEKKSKATSDMISRKLSSSEYGPMNAASRESLLAHYREAAALRLKNAAYDALFRRRDGKTFRAYIRKGYQMGKVCFDYKVLVYYLLSFFSLGLCIKIKSMKRNLPQDIVVDVVDLRF